VFRLKCLGGPLYGQEYSHAQDGLFLKTNRQESRRVIESRL